MRISASSALVAENSISATSATGGIWQHSVFRNNGTVPSASTFLAGSTGNTFLTVAGCTDANTVAGTLYYTNASGVAASCP